MKKNKKLTPRLRSLTLRLLNLNLKRKKRTRIRLYTKSAKKEHKLNLNYMSFSKDYLTRTPILHQLKRKQQHLLREARLQLENLLRIRSLKLE